MAYAEWLKKIKEYVIAYTKEHEHTHLLYHNLEHFKRVAAFATQISEHYEVGESDAFVVRAAAWFHDLGYYMDVRSAGHEKRGAALAKTFLTSLGVGEILVSQVEACIMSTQMPQRPATLLEQMVCDSDLSHLGSDGKDFKELDKLLHKEIEAVLDKEIPKKKWRQGTIELLENHHYHTEYSQRLLEAQKQKNLNTLLEKQMGKKSDKKNKEVLLAQETLMKHLAEDQGISVDQEKSKKKRQDRSVDTVFRIASANNQRLSTQADSKAHIMIQVNSIIISVIISLLLRKIESHPNIAIPSFMLITVNLVTIIFSILATRPNIPKGTFNAKDLEKKEVNLLFFGNFYKMKLDEYAVGMQQVMEDADFLYNSLIRDVYFQGVALGKKYRLLRLSYNMFMFGLVISVVAYVLGVTVFAPR